MPQPELWVGGRRILGGNTRYFSNFDACRLLLVPVSLLVGA